MNKTLRIAFGIAAALVLCAAGFFAWSLTKSSSLRSRTIETHLIDFPVPFPLTAAERATLEPGEDPQGVALQRAIERGRHLVDSRYLCSECHGADFSGGVMVDDPALGRLLGPNITRGAGSRTLAYAPSDWDRIVRHGIKPDGSPGVMPSEDSRRMSDQELSDIVAYLRSMPAVDNEVPPVRMGPLGILLMALGQFRFAADVVPSHTSAHPALPPPTELSLDFGRHLAGVCVGCHRDDLAGGPIAGGDPSWPPAGNLTRHEDGLAGWTLGDFRRVLVEGTRPDGTEVGEPMRLMRPYAANMTDVETEALWMYLQSVRPVAGRE